MGTLYIPSVILQWESTNIKDIHIYTHNFILNVGLLNFYVGNESTFVLEIIYIILTNLDDSTDWVESIQRMHFFRSSWTINALKSRNSKKSEWELYEIWLTVT